MPMKQGKRYKIDWTAPSSPRVIPASPADPQGRRLAEVKQEIIDHFREIRDHAIAQIRDAYALRADDIAREAIARGGIPSRKPVPHPGEEEEILCTRKRSTRQSPGSRSSSASPHS
jgi:hypothetical protein